MVPVRIKRYKRYSSIGIHAFIIAGMLILASPVQAAAASKDSLKVCLSQAISVHNDTLKSTLEDRATSFKTASQMRATALKAAGKNKTAVKLLNNVYKEAIKRANESYEDAKKAANDVFKTAVSGCRK